MTFVLIDSSAWIDFFRGARAAVSRIDALLEEGAAATTEVIVAEVASGARSRQDFDALSTRLAALEMLLAPEDLWPRVSEARFALARQGVQAEIIDLSISLIAERASARLLTRDRDFVRIAKVLPVEVEIF